MNRKDKIVNGTAKTLVIGVILIIFSNYWVVGTENRIIWEITDFSLLPTVIFTIFIIALINLIFSKYLGTKFSLSSSDLAIIYVMLSVATALLGHDMIRQLMPIMGNAFWFATPENEWEDLFFRYLPDWLTVSEPRVLDGYYRGNSNFFIREHINAWLVPCLAWTAFTIVLLFGMLCVNIIVRKQWTENEKLSYPIIRLPLEISNNPRFLKNGLMWLGFGISGGIELLAGLHYHFPVIPSFRFKWSITQYLTSRPWNAIDAFDINIYGFAVGLAFFMPLSLAFSLWFFNLFWKFQLVFFSIIGWRAGGGWQAEQRAGAWLGIGILALITSRTHIKNTLVSLVKGNKDDELYKLAYIGLIFSAIFMIFFWYRAGCSVWAIIIYFIIFGLLSLAITRMRAELGPPTHELHSVHPDQIMVMFAGTRPFGASNLVPFALLDWIAYGYRCSPMPHQLEAFKLSERLHINYTKIVIAMMLAAVIGTIASIIAHLGFYYKYPGYAIWGTGPFYILQSWMSHPTGPDRILLSQLGFGFFFTTFLMIMTRRYLWWPFHPVGYAVGSGWAISYMWFSVFLSWLAKRLILAYGGSKAYRKVVPLFLGFIVGQFFMGSFWSLLGILINKSMYTIFP
ncbi:MAG: DUF6785 family protein [bacterium]